MAQVEFHEIVDEVERVSIPDLPGNSFKERRAEPMQERKKLKQVTNGAKRRKAGIGKQLKEDFLSDETPQSVWGYIWEEVLIPAAKDTISDMVTQGIEMLLFGETRTQSGSRRRPSSSRVSYQSYYEDKNKRGPRRVTVSRERYNIDDIILDTRGDAELVLDTLQEQIDEYGAGASVADLYQLVGIEDEYTDNKWGWTDLRGVNVVKIRGGWLLDLPRPKRLD